MFEDKAEHTTKTKRATEVLVPIEWVKVEGTWVAVGKIVTPGAGHIVEMTGFGRIGNS